MLDSGAHSLFNLHARDTNDFSYYESDEFWQYVDNYAVFVKKYKEFIDLYVNVDVIKNPELSWKVQCYLEEAHGLTPLPVVHHGSDLKWLKRYLDKYEYIGLGGVASGAGRPDFYNFADGAFEMMCGEDGLPKWKVHGFAMTSLATLMRYPFYSVDSTAWVKAARVGILYIPRQTKGQYDFTTMALQITVSEKSPLKTQHQKHYNTLSQAERTYIDTYLATLGVTFEEVTSQYRPRDYVNVMYFHGVLATLPEWPWEFRRKKQGLIL
jgi:hypothetical protein